MTTRELWLKRMRARAAHNAMIDQFDPAEPPKEKPVPISSGRKRFKSRRRGVLK
jgi:hypothetical protein